MRRTTSDWAADIGLFLFAVGFSVITSEEVVIDPGLPPALLLADQVVGALGCAALFLRRRWPVHLAATLLITGTVCHFMTGATLVALFTVAVRRPPRTTGWVAALAFAPVPIFLARGPEVGEPATDSALTYFALLVATFGWGLFVRSRRQVVAGLREKAERAVDDARREAREDIARDMHDVLAHRLSLLSVHAGALEFHPSAPADEVRQAAGVIRDSAHQALEDLREIIGVLRDPVSGVRPQPGLTDLTRLVDEARGAGQPVTLDQTVTTSGTGDEAPSDVAGRTAYHVVREGLTNARKHAPGAHVAVTVNGAAGHGLTVKVHNAAPPGGQDAPAAAADGPPGSGRGLIGLAERARLVGGHLEHGPAADGFRLRAWIPWRGDRDPGQAVGPAPDARAGHTDERTTDRM